MEEQVMKEKLVRIEEKMDKLYESWFGNGKVGVKTEVELLKTQVGSIAEEKKWLSRLIVGTLIPVLIVGAIAITKLAWSSQSQIQQEIRQVVPNVDEGK